MRMKAMDLYEYHDRPQSLVGFAASSKVPTLVHMRIMNLTNNLPNQGEKTRKKARTTQLLKFIENRDLLSRNVDVAYISALNYHDIYKALGGQWDKEPVDHKGNSLPEHLWPKGDPVEKVLATNPTRLAVYLMFCDYLFSPQHFDTVLQASEGARREFALNLSRYREKNKYRDFYIELLNSLGNDAFVRFIMSRSSYDRIPEMEQRIYDMRYSSDTVEAFTYASFYDRGNRPPSIWEAYLRQLSSEEKIYQAQRNVRSSEDNT